jgi:hypothetical protein
MDDYFCAHKNHYKQAMCHLLDKNALTFAKTLLRFQFVSIAFHYNKISLS